MRVSRILLSDKSLITRVATFRSKNDADQAIVFADVQRYYTDPNVKEDEKQAIANVVDRIYSRELQTLQLISVLPVLSGVVSYIQDYGVISWGITGFLGFCSFISAEDVLLIKTLKRKD